MLAKANNTVTTTNTGEAIIKPVRLRLNSRMGFTPDIYKIMENLFRDKRAEVRLPTSTRYNSRIRNRLRGSVGFLWCTCGEAKNYKKDNELKYLLTSDTDENLTTLLDLRLAGNDFATCCVNLTASNIACISDEMLSNSV